MRNYKSLAVVFSSATLLAGCGERRNYTYEPIRIPAGTEDLGEGLVNLGRSVYHAHSFVLKSEMVGKLTCGTIIDESGERFESDRQITPAGDTRSQVDCIYPDQSNTFTAQNAKDEFRKLPVEVISVYQPQESQLCIEGQPCKKNQ